MFFKKQILKFTFGLVLTISIFCGFTEKAEAVVFSKALTEPTTGDIYIFTATANLDKSVYSPGGNVNLVISGVSATCVNGSDITSSLIYYGILGTTLNSGNIQNFTAPNTPGQYEILLYDPYGYVGAIPLTVVSSNCIGPDGVTIADGSSRTYYTSSSVACGQSCVSVTQTRTCDNGVLSGSATNPSCTVLDCDYSCVGPDGVTIADGSSRTYYTSSSVACGQSCVSGGVSETRTCTRGVLSGTASNRNCSVGACSSCVGPDNSIISDGGSKVYYIQGSVPCGQNCNLSQTRVCNNGVLSGEFTNSSCTVAPCSSCVGPDGVTIADGSSRTYYTSSSVACGQSCVSGGDNGNGGIQNRSCNNGVLSGDSVYRYGSCFVDSCPCLDPEDGRPINSGVTITRYSNNTTSCGLCNSLQISTTCNNGVWSNRNAIYKNCVEQGCSDFSLNRDTDIVINTSNTGATSTQAIITVSPQYGFTSNINLSFSSNKPLPNGTRYFFYTNTSPVEYSTNIPISEYQTGRRFGVYIPTSAENDIYTLTITGRSGSITKTVDVILRVSGPIPVFGEF